MRVYARGNKVFRSARFETVLKHKSGRRINVEINAGNPPDIGGESCGLSDDLLIIRDITDRKRNQESLMQMTQFFEMVIDNADVWLSVFNRKLAPVIWNKAASEITGFAREEVIARNHFWDVICPDSEERREFQEMLISVMDGQSEVEGREMRNT
jgi:PAS domain-containing protein